MKVKNFKVNNSITPIVLSAAIAIGGIIGPIAYYTYDSKKQICEKDLNKANIFIDENGKTNCYFDIGEHIIKVSRNDAYYHKSEEIEGYMIKEVEINGWRDNNKVTYVNIVPVVAIATNENNGNLEFNNFGSVATKTFTKNK